MFGFPTRSRYLYHRYPGRRAYPWPPKGVIDRELAIAVSQFAPGGQVVKDKAIHTAVGVAGWAPSRRHSLREPNPLGPREDVARMPQLPLHRAETPRDATTAPSAARSSPVFRVVDLAQPVGFRTDFRPRDFEGTLRVVGAAHSSARVSPDPASLTEDASRKRATRAGSGRIYVINDNERPRLPVRRRQADRRLPMGRPRLSRPRRGSRRAPRELDLPEVEPETEEKVALGASYVTDVLLVRDADDAGGARYRSLHAVAAGRLVLARLPASGSGCPLARRSEPGTSGGTPRCAAGGDGRERSSSSRTRSRTARATARISGSQAEFEKVLAEARTFLREARAAAA